MTGGTRTTSSTDEDLLGLADRLVREFVQVPAGSVLRCLAEAVRSARAWDCPAEHLMWTAEASTRWRLAGVVPGQRTAAA